MSRRKRQEHVVRWARAPDFAEVAEALQVRTDQIMAMREQEGNHDEPYFVLYTPYDDQPEEIYSVTLARDADGVLVVFGEPEHRPGMWAEIKRRMEGSN